MFKLLEIEFINHPFFGSLAIKFTGVSEEDAKNYTTLIIGPNGTGKSQILLAVISIFNSLEVSFRTGQKYNHPYYYKLRFTNKGLSHVVEYGKKGLLINGAKQDTVKKNFYPPSRLIISAYSFNDKYPLRENRGTIINENYYYLGLKSTSNNIFINNPPKDAIANLNNAIQKGKDIIPLKEAFTTLELKPELKLVYKQSKNFKFLQNNEFWENKKLNAAEFTFSFSAFVEKRRRKNKNSSLGRFGIGKMERLLADDDKIQLIVTFLNDNIRLVTDSKNKELSLKPFLDFNDSTSFKQFANYVQSFQLLSDLEIVSFDRFEIKKLNINFPFDNASSGEYHIILTFLNILSLLEDNSLVLLDEPEISLHPNWQIKYMSIFNKIFNHFPNTHFIIASHSHFLVSDLKSESSIILSIDLNEANEIEIKPVEKNTFGWSAEQVLLDVFKVPSTRNYFITKTITDVLKELAKERPDFDLVKSNLDQVIFLDTKDFNDHDPMKDIFFELTNLYNDL
jgi:predicted ATPase